MYPFQSYHTILCFLCALYGCYSLSTSHLHRRTFFKGAGEFRAIESGPEIRPILVRPTPDVRSYPPGYTNRLPTDHSQGGSPDPHTTISPENIISPHSPRVSFPQNTFTGGITKTPKPEIAQTAAKNRLSQLLDKFTTSGGFAKLREKLSQVKLRFSGSNPKTAKKTVIPTTESEIELVVQNFIKKVHMKAFRKKFDRQYQSAIESIKSFEIDLEHPLKYYFPTMQPRVKKEEAFAVQDFSRARASNIDFLSKAELDPTSSLALKYDGVNLGNDAELEAELFRYSMLNGFSKLLSEARETRRQLLPQLTRLNPETALDDAKLNLAKLFKSTVEEDIVWRESLFAKLDHEHRPPAIAVQDLRNELKKLKQLPEGSIKQLNLEAYPNLNAIRGDEEMTQSKLDTLIEAESSELQDGLMNAFHKHLLQHLERNTGNDIWDRARSLFESRYLDWMDQEARSKIAHPPDGTLRPDYAKIGEALNVYRTMEGYKFLDTTKAYVEVCFNLDRPLVKSGK